MNSQSTILLLLLLARVNFIEVLCRQELEAVETARSQILRSLDWAKNLKKLNDESNYGSGNANLALGDCVKLYESCEPRLARLLSGDVTFSHDDAVTWLSAALASNRGCLDGLESEETGFSFENNVAQNLTLLLEKALVSTREQGNAKGVSSAQSSAQDWGLLASWDSVSSNANFFVAKDGSGGYTTINEAMAALAAVGPNRPERVVIYVKCGVYEEQVEIGSTLTNVMLVGDGIDRTIVTGNRNVRDGETTLSSSTFGVYGDGFWARDITFENTAGPRKDQAVALTVHSDQSIFYRCSFRGYQDTLSVFQLRQFYLDCQIYGTVDFIFGYAAVVFQNCDIFVRRPLDFQYNVITAQGRETPNWNTGISIIDSRVLPAPDFVDVKGMFKSYLGRPWSEYARVVFIRTRLDDLVAPEGWGTWDGDFALSTLYFAEFMNTGDGANITKRVTWPGFHVLQDLKCVSAFSVRNLIQGDSWIQASGVPFSADL